MADVESTCNMAAEGPEIIVPDTSHGLQAPTTHKTPPFSLYYVGFPLLFSISRTFILLSGPEV